MIEKAILYFFSALITFGGIYILRKPAGIFLFYLEYFTLYQSILDKNLFNLLNNPDLATQLPGWLSGRYVAIREGK